MECRTHGENVSQDAIAWKAWKACGKGLAKGEAHIALLACLEPRKPRHPKPTFLHSCIVPHTQSCPRPLFSAYYVAA